MNSFSQLIGVRRSMRKFTEEPIDAEQVKLLLRSALIAPTSKGMHSPEFVVVEDKQMLKELSRCKSQGAGFLAEASMGIVVLAEPSLSDVWIEDASVAATHILLQAEDLGLGACWIQVRERYTEDERSAAGIICNLLGIPAEKGIVCIIALGHKGMERKPQNEDRLKWENVHIGQY